MRNPLYAAALLVMVSTALPATSVQSAALPPLIPREVLFGNPERASPQLSPDGRRLAYLKADAKNVLQVFVRTIGKADDRQVTNDPKRGIRQYLWAYNGDLLYLQDSGGDENFHIFAVDMKTDRTRDLTPYERTRAAPVAVEPDSPTVILAQMNQRDKQLFDLYRIDLTTGEAKMLAQNPGDFGDWITDAQLRVRGATRINRKTGETSLLLRDGGDGDFRTVLTWKADDDFSPVGFSKDGRTLYVESNLESDTSGVYAMDASTGKSTLLASDPRADVSGFVFNPRTNKLEAVSFTRDRRRWQVLDREVKRDFAALPKIARGDWSIASRDLADRTWLVAFGADTAPVRYYTWNRDAQKADFLFSAYPQIEKYQLAEMRAAEIKAGDGLMIPILLTLPVGVEAKNLPTVLYVHGGPWARDTWGYNSTAQWLANRGYAVLQVNYRGSTGFGKRHKNLAKREFAGKMHDDLVDAVEHVKREGVADPKRIAIMGGSYGGYATLVGLTFTPDLFAAGVDIVGPSNLVSLIKSFPPYWQQFLSTTWTPFVGDPNDPAQRADLEARSPLFKIDRIKAPLLVGQGANDPRVVKAESDQMVAAMRKAGKPVEYIVFADEGHGFARPENRLFFNAKTEEFLARHLGGRAEPVQEIKGHSGTVVE